MDKLGKKGGATGEDFENELQSSVSAFEALERDFQEVIQIDFSPFLALETKGVTSYNGISQEYRLMFDLIK